MPPATIVLNFGLGVCLRVFPKTGRSLTSDSEAVAWLFADRLGEERCVEAKLFGLLLGGPLVPVWEVEVRLSLVK